MPSVCLRLIGGLKIVENRRRVFFSEGFIVLWFFHCYVNTERIIDNLACVYCYTYHVYPTYDIL